MAPRRARPADDRAADRVADRLHSAAIRLLRRLRRVDDESGLSAPRLSALSVVVFAGPLTLGELAAAEQVRPPTMTRLVRALEARGLVVREPDAADRRVTRIRASAKGKALLTQGRARRVAILARELQSLPPGELAALDHAASLLEQILRALP